MTLSKSPHIEQNLFPFPAESERIHSDKVSNGIQKNANRRKDSPDAFSAEMETLLFDQQFPETTN